VKREIFKIAIFAVAIAVTGAASPARHRADTVQDVPAAASCSSDSALCLNAGRFRVEATWKAPDGSSGTGHPVPLTSDSGYFWFFDPSNPELIAKALNGCGINERFWFFAGGLTNLDVTITVTDTASGDAKTYSNPPGTAFRPIIDTSAFSSCSAEAVASSAESLSKRPAPAPPSLLSRRDLGCAEGDTVLCIDGRFQVEATWQIASGESGPGFAVPLTGESGYFWFFQPSNVEMIVKRLDACTIGQGQWFFAAGLTNVGVRLRVTDTFTGDVRTYTNPLGTPFVPVQDTGAFSFCPTPTATATPTPTPTFTPRPTKTPTVNTVNVNTCGEILRRYCFLPNTVRVHVGDIVQWNWTGSHSSTSGNCSGNPRTCAADGRWDSGIRLGAARFRVRFLQVGIFHYFCSVGHPFPFCPIKPCRALYYETGTVIVDP
jgi:plastocyanin